MTWSVVARVEAPVDAVGLGVSDHRVAALSNLLGHEYGGDAFGCERSWTASVTVAAVDPVHTAQQAAVAGRMLILDAASQVGLPMWPLRSLETVPELVGAQEAAATLGVSRQRLHELRSTGRFPSPLGELRSGPIWLLATINAYLEQWDRRPGRRAVVPFVGVDGIRYQLTTTADEKVGLVWVDAWLVDQEPALRWIRDDLGLTTTMRDNTSGPAIYRVPRVEWTTRMPGNRVAAP